MYHQHQRSSERLGEGRDRTCCGKRCNAPAGWLSTFLVTQCSLSSQTKKYADVIIPRGADNEGEQTQILLLCPGVT